MVGLVATGLSNEDIARELVILAYEEGLVGR